MGGITMMILKEGDIIVFPEKPIVVNNCINVTVIRSHISDVKLISLNDAIIQRTEEKHSCFVPLNII